MSPPSDIKGVLSQQTAHLDPTTLDAIGRIVLSGNLTGSRQAAVDASRGLDLIRCLTAQYWASDRDRRLYTKHYLIAQEQLRGHQMPEDDQLYFALVDYEQRYSEVLRTREEERRRAFELVEAKARATTNPISGTDFEPGIIQVPLETARRDARWCEDNIAAAERRTEWADRSSAINWKKTAEWLRLRYVDGAVLDIPLLPQPALFRTGLPPTEALMPFFRRHKASGRLVPFQATSDQYKQLVAPQVPDDVALEAVPPRFDAVLTPRILGAFDLANSRWQEAQLWGSARAFGTLATATSLTSISPQALATSAAKGAGSVAKAAVQAGGLARAALQEIRFAVVRYGISRAGVTYIAGSAWTFYLRNAVTLNLAAVVGPELILSLAGADMGPIGVGDQLSFAVQTEKSAYVVARVEVEEIDAAKSTVTVKLTKPLETVSTDEAKRLYDSGRMIHHEPLSGPRSTRPLATTSAAIDDTKVAGTAVQDKAVAEDAKALANKTRVPTKKLPAPSGSIHLVELLTDVDVAKLEAVGVNPVALKKLRTISIAELERMGLKATDVTNLYRRIRASKSGGGPVVDFINRFYEAPGFEGLVLNWARGGNARAGSTFAMKYALAKYPGYAIRFEWPVGAALSRAGEEGSMAARYVDIVLDGGSELRPGEALRIELKSWTDRYLSLPNAQKTISRQLTLDTAIFDRVNIKWIFDSTKKATKNSVISALIKAIRNDPYLRLKWQGTDDELRALLKQLVEMYP